MDWMADRLADPEVRAGYLAAHAREVREQVARELIPVVAHKGRNDTDLSLLDEAAHRVEHGYSLDSNITTPFIVTYTYICFSTRSSKARASPSTQSGMLPYRSLLIP